MLGYGGRDGAALCLCCNVSERVFPETSPHDALAFVPGWVSVGSIQQTLRIELCDGKKEMGMMHLDLHQLMQNLSARRLVFHSEADFQHELAW
ncbi:hypothetical protein, partial [Myxococcus vastator]|uniref:hypothetical protein n=1 Tax=Myxococcus vastator TaxID=2709664 RepID=UPI0019689A77